MRYLPAPRNFHLPTVLRKNGFRFLIPTLDHGPAHVHVEKGGAEAKFNLDPVDLVKVEGMRLAEVNEAFIIACQHQTELLSAWRKIHPHL